MHFVNLMVTNFCYIDGEWPSCCARKVLGHELSKVMCVCTIQCSTSSPIPCQKELAKGKTKTSRDPFHDESRTFPGHMAQVQTCDDCTLQCKGEDSSLEEG